jgi:hypothetical protein
MKKHIIVIAVTALLTAAITIGTLAASGAVSITATLDPGVSIKYDGAVKQLTDVNGNAVYPILYNGTTYVPVRGVAGLFGVAVDWDAATRSVLLGKDAVKETFLKDLKPSNKDGYQLGVSEFSKDKFDNVYRDCLTLNIYAEGNHLEYFLNKQYSTLAITIAPDEALDVGATTKIHVYGDSKSLYTSESIDYKTQPFTILVDVSGQDYIRISGDKFPNRGNQLILLADAKLS